MFAPRRTSSAPVVVFPSGLESMISDVEKCLIKACAFKPEIRSVLKTIDGYSKSRLQQAVTRQVMNTLNEYGVTQFGTTASTAKVLITSFLEEYPELKDENPEKCFTKIVYFFSLANESIESNASQSGVTFA